MKVLLALLQMAPSGVTADSADMCWRDAEAFRDGNACNASVTTSANHQNVSRRQLRLWVCNAARRTAFIHHVLSILAGRSKKEMVWSHAQRIVASMAHLNGRVRNGAMRQLVSNARGMLRLSVKPELAISIARDAAAPEPAVIALTHTSPETLRRIDSFSHVCARAGAVAADLGNVIRHHHAALSARLADFIWSHACARSVIALSATVRRDFARAAHLALATHRADRLNSRRVVLPVSGVTLLVRHRHSLYCIHTAVSQ